MWYNILVACFIPNSLYLLLLYPCLAPPPSLSTLVTTSLFSISVSLLLFCYVHWFVVFFYIPRISDIIQYLSFSVLFHLA